jgi:tetratricopeptide (TPR) repeat protein
MTHAASASAATTFSHSAPTFSHTTSTLSHDTPAFAHTATSTVPAVKFATSGLSSGGTHFAGAGEHAEAFHAAGGGAMLHHPVSGAAFVHSPGGFHPVTPHVYHSAYVGTHPVVLAGVGYHPSYLYHPFYHGPWSGHAWGWGWGLGPGFGFGFGGGGWGIGYGGGWGYGGMGYGGYGPYGPYGYWGRPLGWGFGGWGLGTIAYNSGYYPYYNPYYYPPASQPAVYNYSSPIPVATNVGADPGIATVDNSDEPPPTVQSENPDFDAARSAFREGDYNAALASIDAAIARQPTDAVLHEFRGLALFALRNYKQAAAVIHSLLAVGPGWDWTTMSSLYEDPAVYSQQLRALEDYVLANPKKPESHFLLAYHYTICNHSEAAAGQLQQVARLMPDDRLAGELLKMIQGPPKQDPATPPDAAVTPMPPAEDEAQPPPLDKDLLPGNWKSSRPDGSKFALKLTDDGKFTWKFSPPKQKEEEFGGTYSIEGPVLILQRAEGGALAGTATFDGNDKFNFRMVGAPPEDKGLDFGK